MEKDVFDKAFSENLNKNFDAFSKYFDFEFKVFSELGHTIFEINKCLILEFHKASITLTNNLLERLLKLALIYNEAGIGSKPFEDWEPSFKVPNEKYNQIQLGNSIELCKKFELITEKEKDFLFDIIRVLMRNGFSHADSTNIMADFPDNSIMFQGSLDKPGVIEKVELNQKVIPFMQAIQMDNFAKENAPFYFKFVYNLIFDIETRLNKKSTTKNSENES